MIDDASTGHSRCHKGQNILMLTEKENFPVGTDHFSFRTLLAFHHLSTCQQDQYSSFKTSEQLML